MGTARVNREEGGDDVYALWPLCPGLQACYNGRYNGTQTRESQPIPKKRPQFGSESATRLREARIASNRGSERRGEYVLGPCTHRPSRHGSLLYRKLAHQPAREVATHGMAGDWGEVVTR